MKQTILVVEDQQVLREIMKEYLEDTGYEVLEAKNGIEALALFEEKKIHLLVLDIMLPEIDGWSVCRRIRKQSNVPILMLTSRSDDDDTLLGFDLGADDYVVKPCSPPVLLARCKRLLEIKREIPPADTLVAGQFMLDYSSRKITVSGSEVRLTHTEFEILAYLMENKGRILTKEQLIMKIWGYDFEGEERTLSSHIRNLRSKLGEHSKHIVTVIRSGYKFEEYL
ncbi:response regulator transcription factor [Amphibacillus cookii]|uniref:response regulator transcription factor n=1 Tax=Amphibacillus cookii TaxID=767787 RepID=UPI00195EAAEE|nr:response regulator transcription factor [Amphibacillus cookii]MBM7542237.1 DNA-binding response OmpR family regulator [Amphibacillus cookii]